MASNNKTTITISEDDALIYRILKAKTGYDLDEIFHMLATEIKSIMEDGLDEKATRINFMIDADLKNSMVHLRFSPLYMGLGNLTKEQRAEVLRAFDYDENFHDLREKPKKKEESK